jgi:hypothetical protein
MELLNLHLLKQVQLDVLILIIKKSDGLQFMKYLEYLERFKLYLVNNKKALLFKLLVNVRITQRYGAFMQRILLRKNNKLHIPSVYLHP